MSSPVGVNIWLVRPFIDRPRFSSSTSTSTISWSTSIKTQTNDRPQAGAAAGVSVNLLVFPLDTLKTRFQSDGFQQRYRSATAIADRVLWRKLYQGVGTVLLVAVPSSGVFFTTYEGLKYALDGSPLLSQPIVHALSSSIAQLVNCAVVTPAEVLKQNAQMLGAQAGQASGKKKNMKGAASATMTVLHQLKRHPATLWRGYSALAARDLPFTALQFPVFERFKEVLMAWRSSVKGDDELGGGGGVFERAWISALSAGAAGSAAAWVTTPFDVVKTRMMLEATNTCNNNTRRSGFRVGKEVLLNEGVRGLFRGGLIRAAFTVVGNGLYMGCYEGAKLYLQEKSSEDGIV